MYYSFEFNNLVRDIEAWLETERDDGSDIADIWNDETTERLAKFLMIEGYTK